MIRFNPTRTHIQKGLLKVGVDLYIDDPASKTYQQQYIQVATEPLPDSITGKGVAFDKWWATVPKIWRLNPALCHFIVVPETVSLADIADYVARLFDRDTLATLDNALVAPNSADLLSPYMRTKRPFSVERVVTKDYAGLIAATNQKLGSLIIPLPDMGQITPLEPQTIDVGEAAIDRSTILNVRTNTGFTLANPANAAGTIDTVQVWLWVTDHTAFWPGIFFLVTGTTYEVRDSENAGAVAAGSEQTISGLGISVETGDYIGCHHKTASGNFYIEADTSGSSGTRSVAGEVIDPGDQASFGLSSGDALSLYGTGTEAGGGYEWTVEVLTEEEKVYCEAQTGSTYDTRRDITDEGDQAQIIADMKTEYPLSDKYYKHFHHHSNNKSCVQEEV